MTPSRLNSILRSLVIASALTAGAAKAHPGQDALPLTTAPAVQPEVTIAVEDGQRIIRANGIPDHATGPFPGPGNPNRIAPQQHVFRMTAQPRAAAEPTPTGMNPFGVAVNGVVLDPAAAEWWRDDRGSGWQYEALGGGRNLGIDGEHAHVQPTGAYHYHGLPLSLVTRLIREKSGGTAPAMVLVGWAADGFPVYGPWVPTSANDLASPLKRAASSYRLKAGPRAGGPGGEPDGTFVQDWEFVAGAGDLDACNGRTGVTPEFPGGTYYYVLTEEYPFIPRQWRGTPDGSFLRRAAGPGPGGAGKKKKGKQ